MSRCRLLVSFLFILLFIFVSTKTPISEYNKKTFTNQHVFNSICECNTWPFKFYLLNIWTFCSLNPFGGRKVFLNFSMQIRRNIFITRWQFYISMKYDCCVGKYLCFSWKRSILQFLTVIKSIKLQNFAILRKTHFTSPKRSACNLNCMQIYWTCSKTKTKTNKKWSLDKMQLLFTLDITFQWNV